MEKLTIFISSTMTELQDERAELKRALSADDIEVVMFEDLGARPDTPRQAYLSEVRDADVYLGVFWNQHSAPTEEEYREARKQGKPCFIYVKDFDVHRDEALVTLLKEMEASVVYNTFRNTVELGKKANHDIRQWILSGRAQEAAVDADVRDLLLAMGYRISDQQSSEGDTCFLCEYKGALGIRKALVIYARSVVRRSDVERVYQALTAYNVPEGIVLTRMAIDPELVELAQSKGNIQCLTLAQFTGLLADFRPYLQRLIEKHEASEIPQFYVPLAAHVEGRGDMSTVSPPAMGQPVRYKDLETLSRGTRIFVKPLERFIDAWLAEPGRNHISIMGDFGTGKTWFCQRYAYKQAKRYLADPTARIPILITLRDYSRAYDVEQLITDALVNRYGVQLGAGYKTFERLNTEGRLLLIFDGFDEMERRVSDYRTTVDNFWELAKVVGPKSKVLLTCRTAYFKHRKEEREVLEPMPSEVSVVSREKVIDLRGREQYEVMNLMEFTDEDIKLALQKRLPTSWEPVYEKIMSLPNLQDLASRPVLLDMIVKTLPQIEDASQVNQATLYEAYIDELLKRRWSEDTDYIPPQDRLFFVQELVLCQGSFDG